MRGACCQSQVKSSYQASHHTNSAFVLVGVNGKNNLEDTSDEGKDVSDNEFRRDDLENAHDKGHNVLDFMLGQDIFEDAR